MTSHMVAISQDFPAVFIEVVLTASQHKIEQGTRAGSSNGYSGSLVHKTVPKLIVSKTQIRLDCRVECLCGKNQSVIIVALKAKGNRSYSFCSLEDLDQTITSCFEATSKVVEVSKHRFWFYNFKSLACIVCSYSGIMKGLVANVTAMIRGGHESMESFMDMLL